MDGILSRRRTCELVAECGNCNWFIRNQGTMRNRLASRKARNHTRETGHSTRVESEVTTIYWPRP